MTTTTAAASSSSSSGLQELCWSRFTGGLEPPHSTMLEVYTARDPNERRYRDRQFRGTAMEYEYALEVSTTVYVGNLSFYTTEEQIWELFSQASGAPKPHSVKRITMGLNRENKTPCGFCFVEFHTRRAAEQAVAWVSGRILDDRAIRVDIDWGFREGRQYGRGKSGGQVRDEYRMDYDEGRGGYSVAGAGAAEGDDEHQASKRQRQ